MRTMITSVFLTFFSVTGLSQQIQCPGNTQFISVGDTIAQVVAQCGQPKKTIDLKKNLYAWTYHMITVAETRLGFVVLFENNVVKDMVTLQKSHRTTIPCTNGPISVGSSAAQVQAACGQPVKVRNFSQQADEISGKTTHLIYQSQSYLPTTTLVFRKGRLVDSP
jgi:hypothetical protein